MSRDSLKTNLKFRITDEFSKREDVPQHIRERIISGNIIPWNLEMNTRASLISTYEGNIRHYLAMTDDEIYTAQKNEISERADEYIEKEIREKKEIIEKQEMIGIVDAILGDHEFGFMYKVLNRYDSELSDQVDDLFDKKDKSPQTTVYTASEYRKLKVSTFETKIMLLKKKVEEDIKLLETAQAEYDSILEYIEKLEIYKTTFKRCDKVNSDFDTHRFDYLNLVPNEHSTDELKIKDISNRVEDLIRYNYGDEIPREVIQAQVEKFVSLGVTYTAKITDEIEILLERVI